MRSGNITKVWKLQRINSSITQYPRQNGNCVNISKKLLKLSVCCSALFHIKKKIELVSNIFWGIAKSFFAAACLASWHLVSIHCFLSRLELVFLPSVSATPSKSAWSRFNLTFFLSSVSVHDSFDIHCFLWVSSRWPITESATVYTASLKFDHLTSISSASVSSRDANLLRTSVWYLSLVLVSFSLAVSKIICFSACFNRLNLDHILALRKKWSLLQSAPL